jgi:hypothetical protein
MSGVRMPRIGHWARFACRISLLIFALVWLPLMVVSLFQDPAAPPGTVERAAGYVALTLVPVALVTGAVWMVDLMVAGGRTPRRR